MIIAISGKRNVGKSVVADLLTNEFDVTPLSLANPMKRFLLENCVFSREQLYGPSERREEINPRWGKSARQALQSLGTEWGRNLFHEDLWVNLLLGDVKSNGDKHACCVSDLRFPNEFAALKKAGAFTVRVTRPGGLLRPEDVQRLFKETSRHASETALDEVPDSEFSLVIQNNATLDQLLNVTRALAYRLGLDK